MNYYEISSLSHIYLEDSYVLAINEAANSLAFELEAVLTEKHSKYEKPRAGEYYCYQRASLRFSNFESLEWIERRFFSFSDASGEIDYGNIDSFNYGEGWFLLSGDWGKVKIKGGGVELIFAD